MKLNPHVDTLLDDLSAELAPIKATMRRTPTPSTRSRRAT